VNEGTQASGSIVKQDSLTSGYFTPVVNHGSQTSGSFVKQDSLTSGSITPVVNQGYPTSGSFPPVVNNFLRSGVPSGAQLINVQPELQAINQRLPDNYTLIRPNVVDTFRCEGSEFPNGYRSYGYYADIDNDCQIFHVCLPLQQLYPDNFTSPITYQFSFICPEFTIFSQDALVCSWSNEAVPCEHAQELYKVNDHFFSDRGIDGEIYGQKLGNGDSPL